MSCDQVCIARSRAESCALIDRRARVLLSPALVAFSSLNPSCNNLAIESNFSCSPIADGQIAFKHGKSVAGRTAAGANILSGGFLRIASGGRSGWEREDFLPGGENCMSGSVVSEALE